MGLLRRAPGSRVFALAILCNISLIFAWIYLPDRLTSLALFSGRARTGGGHAGDVVSSNATLGFGRIYVVSKEDSPRRKNLLHAANITELQPTIPAQPTWSEAERAAFKAKEGSTIGEGSLLAWMGHLHILRQYGSTFRSAAERSALSRRRKLGLAS